MEASLLIKTHLSLDLPFRREGIYLFKFFYSNKYAKKQNENPEFIVSLN